MAPAQPADAPKTSVSASDHSEPFFFHTCWRRRLLCIYSRLGKNNNNNKQYLFSECYTILGQIENSSYDVPIAKGTTLSKNDTTKVIKMHIRRCFARIFFKLASMPAVSPSRHGKLCSCSTHNQLRLYRSLQRALIFGP